MSTASTDDGQPRRRRAIDDDGDDNDYDVEIEFEDSDDDFSNEDNTSMPLGFSHLSDEKKALVAEKIAWNEVANRQANQHMQFCSDVLQMAKRYDILNESLKETVLNVIKSGAELFLNTRVKTENTEEPK